MGSRQRAPTFRPQLSVRRVYETLEPRSETKELPQSYLLRVYIPGFPRDSVKITYVASSRTVRVTGERQLQGNRWHKIDQSYPIPDYCEPEALQGKFETPILTLTMPKKSQEKGEAKPQEKVQETTPPPLSTTRTTTSKVEEKIEEKKNVSPPRPDLKAQEKWDTLENTPPQTLSEPTKRQEEVVPKPTPPTREATMQTYEKGQKGKEEVEAKPTPRMLTKLEEKGDGAKPTPAMLTKVKTEERSPIEAKRTPTMLTKVKTAETPQKGEEELKAKSEPTMLTKVKTAERLQKGEEEGEPTRPGITNVTRKPSVKEQLEEEKKTEETSAEHAEKEGISKQEIQEEPSESRKTVKDKEEGGFEEKEGKTEKLLAKEAETSAPKDQKKKEKKSSSSSTDSKREENAVEKVGPVSQVFTKIAEGILNEEEKKLAANIGAAILVIAALGYYVSYRFASF